MKMKPTQKETEMIVGDIILMALSIPDPAMPEANLPLILSVLSQYIFFLALF